MMHGFGGWFGMGFMPFFGLIPILLVGGGLYLFFRNYHRGRDVGDDRRLETDRRPADSRGRPRASDLYRLAHKHGGVLTVSDVVVALDADPAEAESALESITDGQRVQMEVDAEGRVTYRFVEIAGRA